MPIQLSLAKIVLVVVGVGLGIPPMAVAQTLDEKSAATMPADADSPPAHEPPAHEPLAPNASVRNTPVGAPLNESNFDTMMRVLTHKRCVNCHPSDGVPRQGEDSHQHYFGLKRGVDGTGFVSTKCKQCHQSQNNAFSGVPGAPDWSLAPESMRWQGLSRIEIAKSILDPKRNGNRTPEKVMHHLTEHPLVMWAWQPGVDAEGTRREVPPVAKDKFIAAVKQWFEDGTPIPENE